MYSVIPAVLRGAAEGWLTGQAMARQKRIEDESLAFERERRGWEREDRKWTAEQRANERANWDRESRLTDIKIEQGKRDPYVTADLLRYQPADVARLDRESRSRYGKGVAELDVVDYLGLLGELGRETTRTIKPGGWVESMPTAPVVEGGGATDFGWLGQNAYAASPGLGTFEGAVGIPAVKPMLAGAPAVLPAGSPMPPSPPRTRSYVAPITETVPGWSPQTAEEARWKMQYNQDAKAREEAKKRLAELPIKRAREAGVWAKNPAQLKSAYSSYLADMDTLDPSGAVYPRMTMEEFGAWQPSELEGAKTSETRARATYYSEKTRLEMSELNRKWKATNEAIKSKREQLQEQARHNLATEETAATNAATSKQRAEDYARYLDYIKVAGRKGATGMTQSELRNTFKDLAMAREYNDQPTVVFLSERLRANGIDPRTGQTLSAAGGGTRAGGTGASKPAKLKALRQVLIARGMEDKANRILRFEKKYGADIVWADAEVQNAMRQAGIL